MGMSIGLDVHHDFCEVAVAEGGRARSAGRVATSAQDLGQTSVSGVDGRPRSEPWGRRPLQSRCQSAIRICASLGV